MSYVYFMARFKRKQYLPLPILYSIKIKTKKDSMRETEGACLCITPAKIFKVKAWLCKQAVKIYIMNICCAFLKTVNATENKPWITT